MARIFTARGYRLVASASTTESPPLRVAGLDFAQPTKRRDTSPLADCRVAVAHSDPGVADGMAQAVRSLGATAAVLSLSEMGVARIESLQPHAALYDPDDLEGDGFDLLMGLWSHRVLRWTPILLTPAACFDASGSADYGRMTACVIALGCRGDALAQRVQKEKKLELSLTEYGPALTLRVLVESGCSLLARFETPEVDIDVDVAHGIVVGAQQQGDQAHILGPRAIAVLTDQTRGRVYVERRARPTVTNIMAPIETALGAAASERVSLFPSSPPPSSAHGDGVPQGLTSGVDPLPPEVDDNEVTQVAVHPATPPPANDAVPYHPPRPQSTRVTRATTPQPKRPAAAKVDAKGTLLGMPAPEGLPAVQGLPAPATPPPVTKEAARAAGMPPLSKPSGPPPAPAAGAVATPTPPQRPAVPTPPAVPHAQANAGAADAGAPGEPAPVSEGPPEAPRPGWGDAIGNGVHLLQERLERLRETARDPELASKLEALWTRLRKSKAAPIAGACVLLCLGVWIGGSVGSDPSPEAGAAAGSDGKRVGATAPVAEAEEQLTAQDEPAAVPARADEETAEPESEAKVARPGEAPAPDAEQGAAEDEETAEAEATDPDGEEPGADDGEDAAGGRTKLERASDLVGRGNRLLRAKRFSPARVHYLKALELHPGYPRAVEGMVQVHIARHEGQQALQMARALVRMRPGRARHHRLLGDAYAMNGDIANAQQAWKRAAHKGDRRARRRLGM